MPKQVILRGDSIGQGNTMRISPAHFAQLDVDQLRQSELLLAVHKSEED